MTPDIVSTICQRSSRGCEAVCHRARNAGGAGTRPTLEVTPAEDPDTMPVIRRFQSRRSGYDVALKIHSVVPGLSLIECQC